MQIRQIKTHNDGIWISTPKELATAKALSERIIQSKFNIEKINTSKFAYAYTYHRDVKKLHCRLVDSVFLEAPDALDDDSIIVTDNHPLTPIDGRLITVLPEFWSIWYFEPHYQDRQCCQGFNCFMHRPRGDRSVAFYELLRRNILHQGIVSYNCSAEEYQQEFDKAMLSRYAPEHDMGKNLIPYNTVESHGTLEQCIIDTNISLIMETYISDTHVVFSEKIFRCLQMPRPWLLYCSPGAIALLKHHGFDVLDDVVNIDYDNISSHGTRLTCILDQLEHFINKQYTTADYQRFNRAAEHNRQLLQMLASRWPEKLHHVLEEIGNL
jgi:hypothetical protein